MRSFHILRLIGIVCFLCGIGILTLTFFPVIKEEVKYNLQRPNLLSSSYQELAPIDADFGLVIPKIGANAKIIPNVDPYDSKIYQQALTRGVAHAKGTVFPGETGNSFIFSHSSANFYEASRYNSVFYLLNKLEKDDEIDVFVKHTKLVFKVTAKRLVASQDVSYLDAQASEPTLTLMTCWPPGTNLKRLLIIAELSK